MGLYPLYMGIGLILAALSCQADEVRVFPESDVPTAKQTVSSPIKTSTPTPIQLPSQEAISAAEAVVGVQPAVEIIVPPTTPTIAPVAAGDSSIGPIAFAGLHCWFDPSDTEKRHAILALHNPTEQEFRVYLGDESALIKANENWYSDHNFRGDGNQCVYDVSIPTSDPQNGHLDVDYKAKFIGSELGEFRPGAEATFENLFHDLKNREIEAIRGYTEPEASISLVAALIGWIEGHEPLVTEIVRCDHPKFEFVSDEEFLPVSRYCQAAITYAVIGQALSGVWTLGIDENLKEGTFNIRLALP